MQVYTISIPSFAFFVVIYYCCSSYSSVTISLLFQRNALLNWSCTFRDKDFAEYTQSRQKECASLIQPSANFVQSEKDERFYWNFNCAVDELCEINVQTKSSDIQADSEICRGHSKPTNRERANTSSFFFKVTHLLQKTLVSDGLAGICIFQQSKVKPLF